MNSTVKILGTLSVVAMILIFIFSIVFYMKSKTDQTIYQIASPTISRTWQVKSIDTMKSSRDQASAKLKDPKYYTQVDAQVRDIKETGANYVAVATPYDNDFLPILRLWIKAARKNQLKVWFRGNFSAWEGWFDYSRTLTRADHIRLIRDFISNNPDLFEDGDIFTACPECENGGPGDHRNQTSIEDFRNFMTDERKAVDSEFKKIGKKVYSNYNSMNLDVAKLVYDYQTLKEMDNLIVVDHYVRYANDFVNHINDLAQSTNAQIMIGEIGAPVPGIHPSMNEDEQAAYLDKVFSGIAKNKMVIGVNWWVNMGGQSAIFRDINKPLKAKSTLEKYFKAPDLYTL